MRLKYFLQVLLLFSNLITIAQTPEWEWAKSAGGFGPDWSNNIITDSYGDIYLCGYGTDTITFDSVVSLLPTSDYYTRNFIAKYSSSGNILWARNTTDWISYNNKMIAIDNSNNLFVNGLYGVDRDTTIFGDDTLIGKGICIFKYDINGNLIWTKSAGTYITTSCEGCGSVGISGITVDNAGNLYFSGFLFGTIEFTVGSNVMDVNDSTYDFIAKYDSNGNPLWAKKVGVGGGSGDDDIIGGITTDSNCNIYITGWFEADTPRFDSISLINTNPGSMDIFIAKYDSSGNVIWANSAGGTMYDLSKSIAVDNDGNVYITGYFDSPVIVFGNDSLMHNISSTEWYNLFIAKYTSSGNIDWVRGGISPSGSIGRDITIDDSGNIYVTGDFEDSIAFDSIILNGINTYENFVVKCDSLGNFLWAKSPDNGTISSSTGSSITTFNNNVYVSGVFGITFGGSTIIFGNDTLVNHIPPDSNEIDIFLAKLDDESTAINTVSLKKPLTIYPNPSYGQIVIDANDITATEIFSLSGKLLRTYKNRNKIDISDLPDGMYFISVQTKTKRYYSKIIKLK